MKDVFKIFSLIFLLCHGNCSVHAQDQKAFSWGDNAYGQLGNGTNTGLYSPGQIGSDTDWAIVACGYWFTVAIKNGGTLWAWGDNEYGQLGDGTTTSRNTPVQIGSGTDWITVSCGGWNALAIKSDGSLWAWGYNGWNQLGDGTATDRYTPRRIGSSKDWASVECGREFTHAIKTDGTLWGWGRNDFGGAGLLGDGTTTQRVFPVQIGTDSDWTSVSSGTIHTVGKKGDGSLWAWGNNGWGQLGDGTTDNRNTPVQIGTGTDWTSVSGGGLNSHAIKGDGSLWAWGGNGNWDLGDGTAFNRYSPVQIGTGTSWVSVSAGSHHSLAIKNDGTLWSWGYNYSGQLGDGTNNDGHSPAQIGTGTNWVCASAGESHSVSLTGNLPHCTISVLPSDNTYTGGVATNLYLGYGPQSATLNVTAKGGRGFTYSWSPSAWLSLPAGNNPVFAPTTEGNYTYVVTVTNSNRFSTSCSVSLNVEDIKVEGSGGKKVYLCHVPSGNPSSYQTLSIATNAVAAHLKDHAGDALGKCVSGSGNKRSAGLQLTNDDLEISCAPNPFYNSFRISYTSSSNAPAYIMVYDMTGKLIEKAEQFGYSNEQVLGCNLAPGIYTVSFLQGSTVKVFKLIKGND